MKYLPASFFIHNRSKLQRKVKDGSIVVITSNRRMPRNGDQHYPFRQSSDLFYLTGIAREKVTLVLIPGNNGVEDDAILYIPEGDPRTKMWDGPVITIEEAIGISGISDVRFNSSLFPDLKKMMGSRKNVYFGERKTDPNPLFPVNELEIRSRLNKEIAKLEEQELSPLMTVLRMFKEPEEIEMIRNANQLTGDAFIRILQNIRPGMREYEVAAVMSHEFQSNGSSGHAFDPIVASGSSALILHYGDNSGVCRDGDLLLMDFGADWQYYAADVSRTIPVAGRYNSRQRKLYDSALRVIEESMLLMRPGITLGELNGEVGKLWEEEHVKLGLYKKDDIKKDKARAPLATKYSWHGVSHSLGIDVHDVFDHGQPLAAGMVLTCEPGLYIPDERTGIRLENDILVTENDPVNLTENIPLDPDAIELIMNKSN